MGLKRFFCLAVVIVAMVSCFSVNSVAANHLETEVEMRSVYASGRFDMDIPAKTMVKANSRFPLEIGEVVTIKATYSPFSSSVDFGLIAPDGLFYSLSAEAGSFDKAIKVTQRGYYTLAVRNNSSDAIHVSGHVNY